jgi:hypothetical protein
MLNFAEQTGSGAVIVVWSFLKISVAPKYINTQTLKPKIHNSFPLAKIPVR